MVVFLMPCDSHLCMGVSFRVRDRDNGEALSGVILWKEYGSRSLIPFTGGAIEVHSTGAYTGAHKGYEVWVEGYVPHMDDFIQNNGRTEDILLSKYVDYMPEAPIPVAPTVPESNLGWIALLGAAAIILH